jgi:hypothetical protein
MDESSSFLGALELLSAILLRCFAIGVAVVLLWFFFFLIGGDAIYAIHGKWFSISRPGFDLLNYYGMAFIKVCNFMLFLVPYLAIRMVLKGKKEKG